MNEVQRSQKAKERWAEIEAEVDLNCPERHNAVCMKLALGWIRAEEEAVNSRYERDHKW